MKRVSKWTFSKIYGSKSIYIKLHAPDGGLEFVMWKTEAMAMARDILEFCNESD